MQPTSSAPASIPGQLGREREEARLRYQAEERLRAQQRLMAGADCGWTRLAGLDESLCRRNGRTFKTAHDKDKRWSLFRVANENSVIFRRKHRGLVWQHDLPTMDGQSVDCLLWAGNSLDKAREVLLRQ